jgi:hypothetical protein
MVGTLWCSRLPSAMPRAGVSGTSKSTRKSARRPSISSSESVRAAIGGLRSTRNCRARLLNPK